MKFITAVAAFSVAFGFSVLTAGFLAANNQLHAQYAENNRAGDEISSLLRQDIGNGQERSETCQSTASFFECSEAFTEYVNASTAIEDVNLPPDFRFAWQAHMSAWRRQADFLKANSFSRNETSKSEFSRIYANQGFEIERTWFDVLDIGKKYGAVIPPDAY